MRFLQVSMYIFKFNVKSYNDVDAVHISFDISTNHSLQVTAYVSTWNSVDYSNSMPYRLSVIATVSTVCV